MDEIYTENGNDFLSTINRNKACELTSKGYCITKRRQLIDSAIQCPTTLNCRRIDRTDVHVVCKVILRILRKSPNILTRAWNTAYCFFCGL